MKNHNLIIISGEYPPNFIGGVGTLTRNLAVGLTNRGWNILVLTKGVKEECFFQEGIKVVTLKNYGEIYIKAREKAYQHRMQFLRNCVRYIEEKYNFIILMDLFLFPEAYIVSKKFKIPLVSFVNQNFEAIFRSEGQNTYWVSDEYSVDAEDAYYLEKECIRKSFALIFVSCTLRKQMEQKYGKALNHYVIPLGIDIMEMECSSDEVKDREKQTIRIASMGRLSKIKNFDTFIDAAKLVLKQVNEVEFYIYGKGKEKETLYQRIKEHEIEDKVHIEYYHNRGVVKHLKACDIAIVPSLYETFGLTLIEFMYLKKPVICSGIDTFKELIGSSECVIMMENNKDPYEMTNDILMLIHNRKLGKEIGMKAHDLVVTQYTNECLANRLEALLVKLEAEKNEIERYYTNL